MPNKFISIQKDVCYRLLDVFSDCIPHTAIPILLPLNSSFSLLHKNVYLTNQKDPLELARRKKLLPVEEELESSHITYRFKILRGEPGPSIVDYANKEKFELVIIGSRGLNSLQEMVIGSVVIKWLKEYIVLYLL
jgi:nucleotide-binding universal stress UspA family protein